MAQRETLYKGSTGFLYGESEINVPSIDLLQGLKPDTMVQKAIGGLQHPTGDAVRTSSALLSAGVRDMQIYLQDHYLEWPYDAPKIGDDIDLDSYQKTVEEIVYQMICTEAKRDEAGAFLGTDNKYYKINKEVADKYSFVLFNEPDQIWYGWNLKGLEEAWLKIYKAVHNIYPEARCVGPNFSGFNAEQYDHFLSFCHDNNCLPEIISWHELGDSSLKDFVKHYNCVEEAVETYYGENNKPELMVNEYARHYDIGSPGGIVKWLSMFEDKDMSGCMAYWAMANSLNEMASDQNSPTSTWWVYHWYAQMTGMQCPLVYPDFDKTRFYGVASYDESENMGYILFGGSEDEDMSEVVYAENLQETNLMNSSGAVNVKIYAVGFSGQQGSSYKPECIFDGAVQTEGNALRLELENTDEQQAYFAILTKPEEGAEVSTTLGSGISTISYEAENAILLGNATAYKKVGWTAFTTSGRADVGSINNNESGVRFEVEVPEDGVYNASIFYSLQAPFVNPQSLEPQENGQNRGIGKALPIGIEVDGVRLDDIILESTIAWEYKSHADVELKLSAGRHTITYRHIIGNEESKGNLQLTTALDKLDLTKIDSSSKNDFEIDLTEMTSFRTENGYEVTAVAPESGYYKIIADGSVSFTKQVVDYAPNAETSGKCSTYDAPVSDTVYLSKGANTIGVNGRADKLSFVFEGNGNSTVISADEITLHGNNAVYKSNPYANSGKVIAELGVGQGEAESFEHNYIYFDIDADSEGLYNFAIRYTNNEPAPVMIKTNGDTYVHPYNKDLVERYAQISVNGGEAETVYFRNTLSWDTFRTLDVQLKLKKGKNRIKIYNDNSYHFSPIVNSTAPEIDSISVSSLSLGEGAVSKVADTSTAKHSFKRETRSATCAEDGEIIKTCTECGYTIREVIPKTNKHSYDVGRITKKATCTEPGIRTRTCRMCGTTTDEAIAKTDNHDFDNGKVTKKATCGKSGTKTYTCKSCGATKKETIKATGKHTYDGGKVTKAPTSSKAGEITYTCKSCGKKKTESVPKLAKASISKLTAKKNGFTASWKKVSSATGYQLEYSTSSKFSNSKKVTISKSSTLSKSVTKLKAKKKYYVRIRTYRTVNGKKYYSSWSKVKNIKTK